MSKKVIYTETEETEQIVEESKRSDSDNKYDENEETKQQEENEETEAPSDELIIEVGDLDLKQEILYATQDYVSSIAPELSSRILKDKIDSAIKGLAPTIIKLQDRKEVKIEKRTHKKFKDCLFLAQQERQLFMSGPAGSGKTTIGSQIAEALELPFAHISCSAGLSEAHLLGRMLFDGTYVGSDFIRTYEEGGVFLFDEIDAADSNTMLIINSAIANGILSVPNRRDKTHAVRHENFICICAGNTWGNGSFEYHGRNHLDAAFLDRFAVSKVHIDYDVELESAIVGDEHIEIATRLWDIREMCAKNKVRKVVSTRAFISGVRQHKAGKSLTEIFDTFFLGWSEEEVRKAKDIEEEEYD